MRYLGAEDLRRALPMRAAIAAMEEAFSNDREGPPRVLLGRSLFMAGRVGPTTGIKVVSTVPGNPAGIVVVFDKEGRPLGMMDGPTLTKIRTGAAAGLATSLLAREDAAVLTMLGAGAMARDQVEAVRATRPIRRVLVWSRTRARADALARQVGGEPVDSADEAVAEADVVSTATPARVALFDAAAVREGTHLNAVGAFTPDMVEIPADIVHKAFVVVDDREAAALEAGDLLQAGREPDASLRDLLTGRVRPGGHPYTLFKSVGIASQDVAAARQALQRAEEHDLGTRIPG